MWYRTSHYTNICGTELATIHYTCGTARATIHCTSTERVSVDSHIGTKTNYTALHIVIWLKASHHTLTLKQYCCKRDK